MCILLWPHRICVCVSHYELWTMVNCISDGCIWNEVGILLYPRQIYGYFMGIIRQTMWIICKAERSKRPNEVRWATAIFSILPNAAGMPEHSVRKHAQNLNKSAQILNYSVIQHGYSRLRGKCHALHSHSSGSFRLHQISLHNAHSTCV